MFIGHFGVAFGAKVAAPKTSLGTMTLAAQWVDLIWPTLLLLGWERVLIAPGMTRLTPLDFVSYPISHSLLAVVGWASLLAVAYWLIRKHAVGAVWIGIGVLSHWVLDALTHRPDLLLYPGGSTKVGLGLWNSMIGTLLVEGLIFGVGVFLYLRSTRAKDRFGWIGLWTFLLFLLGTYIGNIFGPPPPSLEMLEWVGQGQWLLVAWAYWIDQHREPVTSPRPTASVN
jgi:membrane-bound metal-dependent hydrolase YbcI (DUF457 family)